MKRWFALGLLALICACKPDAPAPAAHPALWEVSGKLGERAWLFGTIHALPERIEWRSKAVASALAASDELALEIADVDDQRMLEQTFAQMAQSPGQPPLLDRLPVQKREAAAQLLEKHGVDPTQFESLETWGAALIMARQLADGSEAKYGIDREILVAARGKPVVEFEGAEGQFLIFDTLPEADQRDLLVATLDEAAAPESEDDRLANAWKRGDMAAIAQETTTGLLADPELREALLIKRNHRWASALAARLRAGERPFVAVGAAHMAGPDGLPQLMAAMGYTVRRVQ